MTVVGPSGCLPKSINRLIELGRQVKIAGQICSTV
jgi:ABC-type phosphate transport system ATPase subunit